MAVEKEGQSTVVRLPRIFTNLEIKSLMVACRDALAQDNGGAVIDFADTRMIDSSGIGALVSLAKEFKNRNRGFSLRNLNEQIHELFVDADLDKIFDIATGGSMQEAAIDLFERSAEIKLDISTQVRGAVCIMSLKGVMNHPAGSRFFKEQFLIALTEHRQILIDLEDLTFFDSLSVSVILGMNKLLKKTGGSLRVCGANYIVADLFSTLNINQVIPFFTNVDEALADWKSSA